MEPKDIAVLVLNLIEASKKVVDNYDFYKEDDDEGLVEDYCAADRCLNAFSSYYGGNKDSLDTILFRAHSYYEPYAAAFDGENSYMRRAETVYKVCFPGAAISTLLSALNNALERDFLHFSYALGVVAAVFYIASKGIGWQRKARHYHIMKNDSEAKTITPEQLSDVLDSEKAQIQAALEAEYEP